MVRGGAEPLGGFMHVDEDDPVETSLGHLLIERGKLDAAGLDRASRLWRGSGGRLHVILTQLGLGACAAERSARQS